PSVMKKQAGSPQWILREAALYLRIYMACHNENVWKSVVIEIAYARSPTDILIFHCQSSFTCCFIEDTVSHVAIESWRIRSKVGLYNVEPPVKIIVIYCCAHPGLFLAISIVGNSAYSSFFPKCA